MATMFPMPKLGLDMTSGVIVRWLVQEGQAVSEGQPIVEIETDKAAQELTAPASGLLGRILQPEGAEVPCGEAMAVILAPGEALPALGAAAPRPTPPTPVTPPASGSGPAASRPARIFISPVARRRAEELGVDLATVVPLNGKIGLEQVEAAARGAASAPAAEAGREPMSPTRRTIAEHMSRSARTVARVGLTLEADATRLQAWRAAASAAGSKVSYNVLLARLAATALKEFPSMNARLETEAIVTLPEVNIGIAVDSPRGLVVPVLRQADRRPLADLQAEFETLSARALEGRSLREDLQGGTFTITNLGAYGVESFLPVINLPECAILGVGAILDKPVAENGQVVVRPRLALTLAFDHRLVDGAPAARFLARLKQLIESAG